jgi:DNA-binding MarR family transcriptional regulator
MRGGCGGMLRMASQLPNVARAQPHFHPNGLRTKLLVRRTNYRYDVPVTGGSTDEQGDAERLRHAVNRLARLMRQQDEGDLGATSIAALATVRKRGPLTLGELAAHERVSPPTMTKVVEKLESRGFVTRHVDPHDRRVARVSVTASGTRHVERARARRAAWLATRLGRLEARQLAQLDSAIELLEAIIDEPESQTEPARIAG